MPDAALTADLDALALWLSGYYGFGTAWVSLLDGGELSVAASQGGDARPRGAARLSSQGLCAEVIRAGAPLLVRDAIADARFARHPATERGLLFYAGVPIETAGGIAGVLCLSDRAPRPFADEDLTILAYLARGVGRLLDGDEASLFEEPGLFTRASLEVLMALELGRRGSSGAVELALAEVDRREGSISDWAQVTYGAIGHEGLAIAACSPTCIALFRRGPDCYLVRAEMDSALASLRAHGVQLRGVGVAALAIDPAGVPLDAHDLERIAEPARARSVLEGRCRVERVDADRDARAGDPVDVAA